MQLRTSNVQELKTRQFDVLVVGGGINGAVTASALSGKGASVALIDGRDFAGGSSQQSSNLVWGGIKYMESFEFGLVTKLCASRNHLIRAYPSSVREVRFLTVHETTFRHSLLKLFAGTWLYWLIGRGFTQIPRLMSTRAILREEPMINIDRADGGFEYSDAFLLENDARFVFQFIRTAMDAGCIAANYVESTSARRGPDGLWHVQALDKLSGKSFEIRARVLVNACGASVDEHNARSTQTTRHRHIFSKGVHLIVNRITPSRRILTFFADDGRLFFAIPMGDKTCIGTTDTRVTDPMAQVTDEDRDFILENINKRLTGRPLVRADIIAERCGVRPLAIEGQGKNTPDWLQLSRKHAVEANAAQGHVSIFGGKLTDCINVGEEVCEEIRKMGVRLPDPHRVWFGEAGASVRADFLNRCDTLGLDRIAPGATGEKQGERLWRLYGEHALGLLDLIRADTRWADILIEGTDYMACEFRYCARREMVSSLDDFLRRRSKIELTVRRDDLRHSKGLRRACEILFGPEEAAVQYARYFGLAQATPSSHQSMQEQHEMTTP